MFRNEKVYPFTKEGWELATQPRYRRYIQGAEKWLEDPKHFRIALSCVSFALVAFSGSQVFATAGIDSSMLKVIKIAQKGIRYLSILTIFYGLYLQLLKRDDAGKKVAIGALIVYICALLVLPFYDMIDSIFS